MCVQVCLGLLAHALCISYAHSFCTRAHSHGRVGGMQAAGWAVRTCADMCAGGEVLEGGGCSRGSCVHRHKLSACTRAGHTHGPLHTDVFQSSV